MDGTILIADDDRTIRTVLTQAFTRAGCQVHATASLTTLLRWVEEGRGDLVISDVVMPDGNGLETLPKIAGIRSDLPVIIISAQNTIMTAVQATEAEAFDYLPKPFDLPDLMKRATRALAKNKLSGGAPKVDSATDELPLIGQSGVMQELYRVVAKILNSDLPTLITGESGTGKSLLARALHNLSDRRNAPFCVAGPGDLEGVEAVHEYLRQAGRGTLLIENVGGLTLVAQSNLVRGLDRPNDNPPRIIATTQDPLSRLIDCGDVRADLYYRIAGVEVVVPTLRARVEDVELLATHFLERAISEGGDRKQFTRQSIDKMKKFDWPGNVRQLEHVVSRLALTSVGMEISEAETSAALGPAVAAPNRHIVDGQMKLSESIADHLQRYFDLHENQLPPDGLYGRILREMEAPLLEIALLATGGNQAKCAELLGINRNTLRKKLTELDINVTRRRKLM